jgi:hypothetical protein
MADRMKISNKTSFELRLVLEPIADSYDIGPGEEVEISGSLGFNGEAFNIELYPENAIGIWVSDDAVVYQNDRRKEPIV